MALSVEQAGLGYRVMSVTLAQLRRHAVARSLFTRTTLERTIHKLGFVQADPIRAPARAQDLTPGSVSGITGPVTWNSATPSWQSRKTTCQLRAFCRALRTR